MGSRKDNLFCGPCSLRWRDILAPARTPQVGAWFGSGTVFLVHRARVGIRWICHLLGLGQGDEVLVPAYNCGTEVDPILASGASPSLYDVDGSAQIKIAEIGAKLTPRVKAVYVTHYFGFPQPLAELRRLCNRQGVALIEDCALSLFSRDGTVMLGSIGDVSVFNFPKSLPVPDGGAVVINNRQSAAVETPPQKRPPIGPVLRGLLPFAKRNLLNGASGHDRLYPFFWGLLNRDNGTTCGQEHGAGRREEMPESYYYDERLTGRRMARISEHILRRVDVAGVVERRRRNYQHYLETLKAMRGLDLLFDSLPMGVCPLSFPVIVPRRDRVCRFLKRAGIDAIAWWSGYHRSLRWSQYPNACFLKDNLMTLPVHQGLSDAHVDRVVGKLIEALEMAEA